VQPMRANYNDLDARNTLELLKGGKLNPLAFTPFHLVSSRPAVLAKGRAKRVYGEILIPEDSPRRLSVTSQLIARGSGQVIGPGMEGFESGRPWEIMPSYQYFLLVLADDPDAYGFLKLTDSVRSPWEDITLASEMQALHYRVVLADAKRNMPVPTSALNLTSVAYIVWDEVNLDRLNLEQKNAILDWIHWGGRLIVNGPDSLASLRGSFLDPYLPADLGESMEIDADRLSEFNDYWTQPLKIDADRLSELTDVWTKHLTGKSIRPIRPTRPWSGIVLQPRDDERDFAVDGTGSLLIERAFGSGSIVVSAFQLTERDLINWEGFDGFLNGALLRRWPRIFGTKDDIGLMSTWALPNSDDRRLDAHFTTPLRWFSRDVGTMAKYIPYDDKGGDQIGPYQSAALESYLPKVDRAGGLGSWSEFNPVADYVRDALTIAAGVRVPAASFVIICLAVYLLVLVPLNWMVFHALGRVEWAWIAAPLIALAGTVVVVQQAQLDIGFVRSQTEIALLELQDGYERGHLTRFTALYSSLSTTYEMKYDEPSAVATPFPADDQFTLAFGDSIDTVVFEKYDQTRLRGVPVTSASTRFVHSEQMYPLEGEIAVTLSSQGRKQLANKTGLDLSDAMLINRKFDASGKPAFTAAWLGKMTADAAMLMPVLQPISLGDELPFNENREMAASIDTRKRLQVDELMKLAMQFHGQEDPFFGRREETRLVARIDGVLPGAITDPEASQTSGTTVVLAHVDYPGSLPPARTDANSVAEVFPNGRPAADLGPMIDTILDDEQ